MNSPTDSSQSNAWHALKLHFQEISDINLTKLMQDPQRASAFSLQLGPLFLDYSKNLINTQTLQLLFNLATELKLTQQIDAMFKGQKINWTENRAVLHCALRDFSAQPILVDGRDVKPDIQKVLNQVKTFSNDVRQGIWKGRTGSKIEDIVHIGIGGSDLGPRFVCDGLKHLADGPDIHFVSNIDGSEITHVLRNLKPETTLFLVASKTFTTQETMTNAQTAKTWLTDHLGLDATPAHFCALTSSPDKAVEFGINEQNCFAFWDFVGGRYSVWSAIGLPIAISLGFDAFRSFLQGAHEVDLHFRTAPLEQNMPVILALIGIWYNNFHQAESYAVLPYSDDLKLLPSYLQQADMESNGKQVDKSGNYVKFQTGPIVWGQAGTNGQHAFYQLIHQGTKVIPVDLIGFKKPIIESPVLQKHHRILMAHYFAQSKALAFGLSAETIIDQYKQANKLESEYLPLVPHKTFKGNRPSNSLLIDQLTPQTLGMLMALYEHKIFIQGALWQINSFDQWGVELGKVIAQQILHDMDTHDFSDHDPSTQLLINHFVSERDY